VDIGFGCLSGMFRAQRRRAVHLLRQRGLHDTGVQRSGPPSRSTHGNDEAIGPEPGHLFGQGKDLPGSPWPMVSPTSPLRRWPTSMISSQGRASNGFHVPLPAHTRPCPLGWGSAPSDTIAWHGSPPDRALSGLRGRVCEVTAVIVDPHRMPVESYLSIQSRTPTSSARAAGRTFVARIQAIADRNILRYGLSRMPQAIVTDGDEPMKKLPFAITLEVDRARHQTGSCGSSGRSTSTGCLLATMPARQERTSRAAL